MPEQNVRWCNATVRSSAIADAARLSDSAGCERLLLRIWGGSSRPQPVIGCGASDRLLCIIEQSWRK